MTRRASGHKEMPDEVGVPDSFCDKEQDSCCICESSGHDPEQSFLRPAQIASQCSKSKRSITPRNEEKYRGVIKTKKQIFNSALR